MSLMIQSERHRFYHRNEIEMDFSAWSPSHTIFVGFVVLGFIIQIGVLFHRTKRLEMRADKTDDRMDTLMADFRSEMNQGFADIRSEIRDLRTEISKLNQNHIDHLTRHES